MAVAARLGTTQPARSWAGPLALSRPAGLALLLCGTLLGLLATTTLLAAAVALVQPRALDYGEPIVYGQAARLLRGGPLYQPLDQPPFTVTAYTPVYYALASLSQAWLGPGFGPGRALSLLAGLAAAVFIGLLTAARAQSRWAGLFAALLFIGLGLPGGVPWLALYRVDTLGVALSLAAVWLLSRGTTQHQVVLAGGLAGLAFLTKQSFLAAAVTGLVWLWSVDRRRAGLFALAVVLTVVPLSVLMELTTSAFFASVVTANINPLRSDGLGALVWELVLSQALPVGLSVAYLATGGAWRARRTRLLAVYWLLSAMPILGLVKVGANRNYWIEFAASTAVLATLGIWSGLAAPRGTARRMLVMGLVCGLGLTLGLTNPLGVANLSGQLMARFGDLASGNSNESVEFRDLVARVQREPRAVLADPPDVLVLADRPVALEPLIYSILFEQGRWDAQSTVRRICSGEVGLLVLSAPLGSGAARVYAGYPRWPRPILEALDQTMTLERLQADRYLYVPTRGCQSG